MREKGYYWVRTRWTPEWVIGCFSPDSMVPERRYPWTVMGCDDLCYCDQDFLEIGPRIIPPNEKPQVTIT
jgi:hypothetical protein